MESTTTNLRSVRLFPLRICSLFSEDSIQSIVIRYRFMFPVHVANI